MILMGLLKKHAQGCKGSKGTRHIDDIEVQEVMKTNHAGGNARATFNIAF